MFAYSVQPLPVGKGTLNDKTTGPAKDSPSIQYQNTPGLLTRWEGPEPRAEAGALQEAPPLPVAAARSWRRGPAPAQPAPSLLPRPPRRAGRCQRRGVCWAAVVAGCCTSWSRASRRWPVDCGSVPATSWSRWSCSFWAGPVRAREPSARALSRWGRAGGRRRAPGLSGPGPAGAAALAAAPPAVGSGLRIPTATARWGRGASSLRARAALSALFPRALASTPGTGVFFPRSVPACQSSANPPGGT